MKKYLYLCLAVVGIAVFASCKSQKAVVASYSDLDGEWSVVELNLIRQTANSLLSLMLPVTICRGMPVVTG